MKTESCEDLADEILLKLKIIQAKLNILLRQNEKEFSDSPLD